MAAKTKTSRDHNMKLSAKKKQQKEPSDNKHDKKGLTAAKKQKAGYVNKQRILSVTTRGSTSRAKKMLEDLQQMLPHCKTTKNVTRKLTYGDIQDINIETNCNSMMLFESRNRQDDFLWIGDCINGPSVKFHVNQFESKNQFRFLGNCLKASRPILMFSNEFEKEATDGGSSEKKSPHWPLVKTALHNLFNVPHMHPKSQPFVDRVAMFELDRQSNLVFIRFYQLLSSPKLNQAAQLQETPSNLQEIGPRFTLQLLKIFSGCLTGEIIYSCPDPERNLSQIKKMREIYDLKRKLNFEKKLAKKVKELEDSSRETNSGQLTQSVDKILRQALQNSAE